MMKGIPLASLVFNYSHNCTNSDVNSTVLDQEFEYDVSEEHERILIETLESVLRAQFLLLTFDYESNTVHIDGNNQSPLFSFSTSLLIYLARDGSRECTSLSFCEFGFDQLEKDIITTALDKTILQFDNCFHNAIFDLKLVTREEILNSFSGFCQLGCAHFYASESDPLHIMPYKRSQVSFNQQEVGFQGGIMEHCPSGTYRHLNSETVEQCTPCPAGRFREDIKGKSLDDCMKCPPRTYNSKEGSSSIAQIAFVVR